MHDPRQRLIVALDVSSSSAAQKIVAAVGESALTYKVGMQLYTAEGPQVVHDLVDSGRRVFLDLKYHDIPTTVAAAVREAAALRVSMLTVHASGGGKMLRAATEAARSANPALMVLAVTVLTSLDDNDLDKIGVRGRVVDQVLRLAALARRYLRNHGISYERRDDFFSDFFTADVLARLVEGDSRQAVARTAELLRNYGIEVSANILKVGLEEEKTYVNSDR